jgi:protein phosphatase 1 regulatory subunit 16A
MDPSESDDSDSDGLTPALEAAMPPEQRLSTQERLRLAKRRRADQLHKWSQREREWKLHTGQALERRECVTFVSSVMLLEAAARNDLAEGE